MFSQFMQMGAPAAFAIVGVMVAIAGAIIALNIRAQVERDHKRRFELDMIEVASKAKMIEGPKRSTRDD